MNAEPTFVTNEDGSVNPPPPLDEMEQMFLKDWLPTREKLRGQMEEYAHWRNIQRAAQSWGPHLISLLIASGAIEPEQDPREALKNVLRAAGY